MIAGMNRLELFVSRDRINPFIDNALAERFAAPISFITSEGSRANGFEAILLADLCEAVLKALFHADWLFIIGKVGPRINDSVHRNWVDLIRFRHLSR